jgi:NitT/TauT family transport system permease protein
VLRAMDSSNTPLIFAVLVVGSLIGVFLSFGMSLLERVLLPWRRF